MWALKQGLPLAKLQTWKSCICTTPGKAFIYSVNYFQSTPFGAASINTDMHSPLIGIVVNSTTTANTKVHIGSAYFKLLSHHIITDAIITPIDYTVSPIT